MKTIINLIIVSTLFISCSALKKAKVYSKMSNELETYEYRDNPKVLGKKLVSAINNSTFKNSRLIILPQGGIIVNESQEKVREKLENGFNYKGKLYLTVQDIGLDLLSMDFNKIKKKVFQSKNYHILENNKRVFLLIKSDIIYEIKKSKNGSKLRVSQLYRTVAPKRYNLDFMKLLSGKLAFDQETLPVDLEKSRKYTKRLKVEELQLFYKLEETKALKMEKKYTPTNK